MHKCLLVGLGNIGVGYDLSKDKKSNILTHAKAITMHSNFELVAGVDKSKARCVKFSQHFDKPSFTNLKSALKELLPDIVIVATSTKTHFNIIKLIIKLCKPKVILCEKPLDYNLSDAEKIIEICKFNNIELFVNYMRISDTGVIEIKKRIRKEIIQNPVKGVAYYNKGFIHNGSHLFNLMEFWLGKYIKSKIINISNYNENDYLVDINVNYENGSIVFLSTSDYTLPLFEVVINCKRGRLFYLSGGTKIIWEKLNQNKKYVNKREIIENNMSVYQMSVYNNLDFFLKKKSHNLCTGYNALKTLVSMNKCLK